MVVAILTLVACTPTTPATPDHRGRDAPVGSAVAEDGGGDATLSSSAESTSTPVAAEPTSVPGNAAERRWEAHKAGRRVLTISNRPGAIVDGNAPPPPPGQTPPPHPFLSATCHGDPMACSRAGELLRASKSLDEFLSKLGANGYALKELGAQQF